MRLGVVEEGRKELEPRDPHALRARVGEREEEVGELRRRAARSAQRPARRRGVRAGGASGESILARALSPKERRAAGLRTRE